MSVMKIRSCLLLVPVLLLAACATVPPESRDDRDPFERYNRSMHEFNDNVDRAILKPVARGYVAITPQPVRTGVGNFFSNVNDVLQVFNNTLQFKFHDAASDMTRLIMNTSFGVLGIFDVATPMGLEKSNEDFGQTLGRWGMPAGPYLVLPFMGPSTVRDAPAMYVDAEVWPITHMDDHTLRNSLIVLDVVNIRARLLSTERTLDELGDDRYMVIRNAWLERREYLVRDGAPTEAQYDMLRELEEDWDDE